MRPRLAARHTNGAIPPAARRLAACRSLPREALLAQLRQRLLGLAESREPHPAEHRLRLRELDLVVLHDLDVVAPRVDEAQAARRDDLGAGALERLPHLRLVVDDEPEVAIVVARLPPSCAQREELIAH